MRRSSRAAAVISRDASEVKNGTSEQTIERGDNGLFDPYGVLTNSPCHQHDHANSKGKPGQKQNCASNPLCIYGLGEYRSGVWGPFEELELVKRLHLTVNTWKERDLKAPAGLDNLGATCYANSLLQTLFHNAGFRRQVYTWRGDSTGVGEHAVALQRLFVALELSTAVSVNPSNFVKMLNLQTFVQQDAQEFNKLLLDHLSVAMTSKLTSMFEGMLQYRTKCKRCQTTSIREAQFFELELPIKGENSISSCLHSIQKPEELSGRDQYMCDICRRKCDADRSMVLHTLPEVLNLQLMRFVFDPSTLSKRKLKDSIDIPSLIKVSSGSTGEDAEYELSAILYHRGSSASAGHYVAEVLVEACGQREWWTFNDDLVEQRSTTNKPPKAKGKPVAAVPNSVSTKDAYMIVYQRVSAGESANNIPHKAQDLAPAEVVLAVQKENEERRVKSLEYDQKRAIVLAAIETRKQLYREAFESQTAKGYRPEGHWVPREWLEQWITGDVKANEALVTCGPTTVDLTEDQSECANAIARTHDLINLTSSNRRDQLPLHTPGQPLDLNVSSRNVDSIKTDDDSSIPADVHSYPTARINSLKRVNELIEFYSRNPHSQMGTVLTDAVLKANLKDAEQDKAFEAVNQFMMVCESRSGDDGYNIASSHHIASAKTDATPNDNITFFCSSIKLTPFTCPHGKISPAMAVSKLKLVPREAWEVWMREGIEFDITLTELDGRCSQCGLSSTDEFKEAKAELESCQTIEKLINQPSGEDMPDDESVWVSKDWLRDLKERNKSKMLKLISLINSHSSTGRKHRTGKKAKLMDDFVKPVSSATEEFPASANADIVCEHGSLVPGKGAKRLMHRADWNVLINSCENGKWRNNHKTLDVCSLVECSLCHQENLEAKEEAKREKEVRDALLKERPRLKDFQRRRTGAPDEIKAGMSLILLPRRFARDVRDFLNGDVDQLESLDFATFSCPHSSVCVGAKTLEFIGSGGNGNLVSVEDEHSSEDFGVEAEFVTEDEFKDLVHVIRESAGNEHPVLGEVLCATKMGGGRWSWSKPICDECKCDFSEKYKRSRTVFTDKTLYVTRLAIGQSAPTEGGTTVQAGIGARSTRQGNKRMSIVTSSTDTIFLLKMKIYQQMVGLKCEPGQIRLHFNGKILDVNDLPLEVAGVRAGTDLFFDTFGNEDDDLVGILSDKNSTERGFAGTALMSSSKPSNKVEHISLDSLDTITVDLVDQVSKGEKTAEVPSNCVDVDL